MAEDIKDTDGEGEEFKPAFTPSAEAADPSIETGMVTFPPELGKNPSGYEPTSEEVEAEAAPYLDMGPGSNADVRLDARRRLIERANMSSGELATDDAVRAAEVAPVSPVGPMPEAPVAAESAPTDLREAVDRVVPGMPEGPSAALTAAMAGEEGVKLEGLPQSALDKFVAEKELKPEEEAPLVAYSNIVIERGKAQVAGDWNKERRIREEQKTAYNALPERVKEFADAYASRYGTDIKQKEQAAEAA